MQRTVHTHDPFHDHVLCNVCWLRQRTKQHKTLSPRLSSSMSQSTFSNQRAAFGLVINAHILVGGSPLLCCLNAKNLSSFVGKHERSRQKIFQAEKRHRHRENPHKRGALSGDVLLSNKKIHRLRLLSYIFLCAYSMPGCAQEKRIYIFIMCRYIFCSNRTFVCAQKLPYLCYLSFENIKILQLIDSIIQKSLNVFS